MIQSLGEVLVWEDDVIISEAAREQHDSRLKSVLTWLVQRNVCIKETKCTLGVTELEFLVYQPDFELLRLLLRMVSLRDQSHLRFFMRCPQYNCLFILNFETRSQTLFLAHSSDECWWTDKFERIMHNLIKIVARRPMLSPFTPNKPALMVTKTFEVGTVAILSQEGSPVICLCLSAGERGYSQTKKKALALSERCVVFTSIY